MLGGLIRVNRAAVLRAYRGGCRAGRASWHLREPIRCPYGFWCWHRYLAWHSGYNAGLRL
jgi:hypothetical protein